MTEKNILCLFDVDGTLTKSRLPIENEMFVTLKKLKQKVKVGLVGGSDLNKISEQMNFLELKNYKDQLIQDYDYVFVENGLIAFENGQQLGSQSILKHFGEDICQELINFCLEYISKLKIPKKRGNFIEFRSGMINVSPIGRSCTLEERLEFYAFDQVNKVREQFVNALTEQFGEKYKMKFSIGGQISIDAFPIGWDKTFCLQFIKDKFDKIYFFGDRTDKGGNDYEIYSHSLVEGYKVKNPEETNSLLKSIFNLE